MMAAAVVVVVVVIANDKSSIHQESIPVIHVLGHPSSSASTAAPTARNHSHNLSVGSLNAHRVTRRKSMSSNATTIAQAMKEAAEVKLLPGTASAVVVVAAPGSSGLGKLQAGTCDGVSPGGYPSPPSSLPNPGPLSNATVATTEHGIQQLRKAGATTLLSGSAIADGHAPEVSRGSRNRRASDGAGALGGVGKIGRMRSGSELKCEKCGKGYKHSSCLTKHLFVFPLHVFKAWFRADKNCFSTAPTLRFGPITCELHRIA